MGSTINHFVQTHKDILSAASLWVKRGSAYDPSGKEGLAHFLEHLFMSRTDKAGSRLETFRSIEANGLYYNAFTGKDTTHYFFLQQRDSVDVAYDFLVEALKGDSMSKEDVEREREVIINEYRRHKINPQSYIWTLADMHLWPDSNLGHSSLGSEPSILSITESDVLEFKRQHYSSDNIGFLTISSEDVAGDFKDRLRPNILSNVEDKDVFNGTKSTSPKARVMCEQRPINVVILALSFLLPGVKLLIEDKIVLEFIRYYLASGWSSKLVEKLRLEKNLVYWVFGTVSSYRNSGVMRFTFSVKKSLIKEVLSLVSEELNNLVSREISEEYLNHHKTTMRSHLLMHGSEHVNLLRWYGWNLFIAEREISFEHYLSAIDSITSRDILIVAQKYLTPQNFYISAIGPVDESDIL